jgi:phosphate transport system ATP-binding protein
MGQAERISDETAFFLSGKLIEMGPTKDIFHNSQNEQTRDYISGKFG